MTEANPLLLLPPRPSRGRKSHKHAQPTRRCATLLTFLLVLFQHLDPSSSFVLSAIKQAISSRTVASDSRISTNTKSTKKTPQLPLYEISDLDRSKLDPRPDALFYQEPNFNYHVDQAFREQLTALYEDLLSPSSPSTVLDLCSSHVSHLPTTRPYRRVDVHGMNAQELQANPFATTVTDGKLLVRDLNQQPDLLEFAQDDNTYDAVVSCAGLKYLQYPEAVLAEVNRVLKPGGIVVLSFSNRYCPTKTIQGWVTKNMAERTELMKECLQAAGEYESIQVYGQGHTPWGLLKSRLAGKDPFVAVVARKQAAPARDQSEPN